MQNSLKKVKNNLNNSLDWDLESILNNQSLDNLYNQLSKNINKLINIYDEGKCYLDESKFSKYLSLSLTITKFFNQISNYVTNKINENVLSSEMRMWEQKIFDLSQKLDIALSNEYNIIFKYEEKIKKFLNLTKYKKYKRLFNLIFQYKPYLLSNQKDLIITKYKNGIIDVASIYQVLSTSELNYQSVYNKNNKKISIKNELDLYALLKSRDHVLRKSAWISLRNAYLNNKNTFTKLLYYNYLSLNLLSKINNFDNFISAQCFIDEIDKNFLYLVQSKLQIFSNLYEKYNKLHFSALKKKYKLKKIYPWDTELNLFYFSKKYSIDEAKSLVLNSLKLFGQKYASEIKNIFNNRWISWLPKNNKQLGSYSIGEIYGMKKFFIFLNYEYNLDSVFSLSHELGHAMHSLYVSNNQTIYCEIDTLTGEIASLVNEMLLSFYLINTFQNDLKLIASIYEKIISNFFDTTLFQIALNDFELQFISNLDDNNFVTSERIFDMYSKSLSKYNLINKNNFNKNKNFKNLFSIFQIEHFYSGSLYVYKYAIAEIVALNIAIKIFSNDKKAIKNYISFLKFGSSKSAIEMIKFLGIDLSNEECWNNALNYINNLIRKYKIVIDKLIKHK